MTFIHGHTTHSTRSPTYRSWQAMIVRCTDHRRTNYCGRNITVCERWLKFENFLADMRERPPGTTLDRYPNNDGNYEPGNCRWATQTEQHRNRRTTRTFTLNGVTHDLKEWSVLTGISVRALAARWCRKWPAEKALSEPADLSTQFPSISFRGETLSAKGWSKRVGISRATIESRLERGWPVDRALTTKPQVHTRRQP
jgi:hypothetical protein